MTNRSRGHGSLASSRLDEFAGSEHHPGTGLHFQTAVLPPVGHIAHETYNCYPRAPPQSHGSMCHSAASQAGPVAPLPVGFHASSPPLPLQSDRAQVGILGEKGPPPPERQHTTGPSAIKWAAPTAPTPNGIHPTLRLYASACLSFSWACKHDLRLFCLYTDAFSLADRILASFPVSPSVLVFYSTDNVPIINQLNLNLSISLIEMHFTEPHLYH